MNQSINHFQGATSVSSSAPSRPQRATRSKPISIVDLDTSDSNNSALDDGDLTAIAEAKSAFTLRNDSFA
jgi:hypothetical protein